MNEDHLFQVFLNMSLTNREEVYRFVSQQIFPNDEMKQEKIITEFAIREDLGDLKIAEHTLLPHIESNLLSESRIVVIQLTNEIAQWSIQIQNIRLLIFVLLKDGEARDEKYRVASFMRRLACDEFIDQLLTMSDIKQFFSTLSQEHLNKKR